MLDWSLHENLAEAKKNLERLTYYDTSDSTQLYRVISDEMVEVIFEGKETMARRISSKFVTSPKPYGSIPMDGPPRYLYHTPVKDETSRSKLYGSSHLINYYLAEEVRGRYVSCTLSHFADDPLTENGLPLLPGKVMRLKR